MKIAITGAKGRLGRELRRHFEHLGCGVSDFWILLQMPARAPRRKLLHFVHRLGSNKVSVAILGWLMAV